jgi:ubiquitin-like protein Pup
MVQKQTQPGKGQQETAPSDTRSAEAHADHAALTDDVDGMLDEIDSVLEENAEEFVKGYVQKGGQ